MTICSRCVHLCPNDRRDKTFLTSLAVPNRAVFWITSSLVVVPSFSICLSNVSDTALNNAPITTGNTVTFLSFHNFLTSSKRRWYLSIFSSSLSVGREALGVAMWTILASVACLSMKTISGHRAWNILLHCTLKPLRVLSFLLPFPFLNPTVLAM